MERILITNYTNKRISFRRVTEEKISRIEFQKIRVIRSISEIRDNKKLMVIF